MPNPESRYVRQARFAPLGEEGQRRISASRVAIVGLGALGSVQAELLARAGAGVLRLIDRDFVELGNLQRQFLYDESDAEEALPKAIAAARRLARVNSEVQIEPLVNDLAPRNADELLDGVNLILDDTDNFETRYLINDYAVREGTPWIYGGAVASYGLKFAIVPGRTACFRCIYPEPPAGAQPTCETAGVLNAITSLVASLQVADALKILSGHADCVQPRITRAKKAAYKGGVHGVHLQSLGAQLPALDVACGVVGLVDARHVVGWNHGAGVNKAALVATHQVDLLGWTRGAFEQRALDGLAQGAALDGLERDRGRSQAIIHRSAR